MSDLSVQKVLERGRLALAARSGTDASREALYLLTGLLGTSSAEITLQRDRIVGEQDRVEYEARLARRALGEPLQYIEGRAAFRQLDLRVDRSVLIPRPETEELVEHVLQRCRGRENLRALDLGTGSAAIAISLALEGPFREVVGVDISPDALNVAGQNVAEIGLGHRVELRQGSLFAALRPEERFDVVVSNPPYIAPDEVDSLPSEVRDWEPDVALYAGPRGWEIIEKIVDGAAGYLSHQGLLALEVAPGVADAAAEHVRAHGGYREPRVLDDLAGRRRVLLAESS